MKNTTILGLVGFVVLLVVGFMFFGSSKGTKSDVTINEPSNLPGETQKVILSEQGFNYKDASVEAGKPIAISADSSVTGCLRSVVFNIDGKKYSKYLKTSNDVLTLPSLEKGTYTFSCTMGMGYGKLIVG